MPCHDTSGTGIAGHRYAFIEYLHKRTPVGIGGLQISCPTVCIPAPAYSRPEEEDIASVISACTCMHAGWGGVGCVCVCVCVCVCACVCVCVLVLRYTVQELRTCVNAYHANCCRPCMGCVHVNIISTPIVCSSCWSWRRFKHTIHGTVWWGMGSFRKTDSHTDRSSASVLCTSGPSMP